MMNDSKGWFDFAFGLEVEACGDWISGSLVMGEVVLTRK